MTSVVAYVAHLWRTRTISGRLRTLEKDLRTLDEARQTPPVIIHNHMPVSEKIPPSLGDVSQIRSMTQKEYDDLTVKDPNTLYFVR